MTKSKELSESSQVIKQWVLDYTDSLYAWAYQKTSNKEIAEDLVQDTFIAAYTAYSNFQQKSKPKTWLFSILNNKITDYYRKTILSPLSLESLSEENAVEAVDSMFDQNKNWKSIHYPSHWEEEANLLDNPEFNKVLGYCIEDLPLQWRQAITLKYLLDKPAEDVCQELKISTTNYWQIMHRAKLLLKKCIELKWKG